MSCLSCCGSASIGEPDLHGYETGSSISHATRMGMDNAGLCCRFRRSAWSSSQDRSLALMNFYVCDYVYARKRDRCYEYVMRYNC